MSSKPRTRTVPKCRGLYAVGASVPSARYHTQQHASLRADRRVFVFRPTPEQQEARYQRDVQEAARRANERKTNGLIMPIGAEW